MGFLGYLSALNLAVNLSRSCLVQCRNHLSFQTGCVLGVVVGRQEKDDVGGAAVLPMLGLEKNGGSPRLRKVDEEM